MNGRYVRIVLKNSASKNRPRMRMLCFEKYLPEIRFEGTFVHDFSHENGLLTDRKSFSTQYAGTSYSTKSIKYFSAGAGLPGCGHSVNSDDLSPHAAETPTRSLDAAECLHTVPERTPPGRSRLAHTAVPRNPPCHADAPCI
jgi:hypothetical protein